MKHEFSLNRRNKSSHVHAEIEQKLNRYINEIQ